MNCPNVGRSSKAGTEQSGKIGQPVEKVYQVQYPTCILLGSVMCLYSRSSCSEICNGPLSTTAAVSTRVAPPSPPSTATAAAEAGIAARGRKIE